VRGHADPAGFVAAFSGSHRFVLDYLADEVLDGQPGQVRAFLLETSVLERLSGELCDAVTGRAGSQAMLAGIERAGLFLVPLDEVRGWWRYHRLFADLGALTEALTLGRRHGHVRVLADEGAPMHALLAQLAAARPGQQHAAHRPGAGYLAALLRSCGQANAVPLRRGATAPPGLAEPLTDRELEVVRLLAAGRSNQRIARDLVVALDTVKST
jgi:ATP/maltotriose-dependent transcriptional regulator MalT